LSKASRYNEAYKKVLDARKGSSSLVNEDGSISEDSLKIIEYCLRKFEIGRQIGKCIGDTFMKKIEGEIAKRGNKENFENAQAFCELNQKNGRNIKTT